jgi:hypothetical protein
VQEGGGPRPSGLQRLEIILWARAMAIVLGEFVVVSGNEQRRDSK